jgi:asparagine synthase (glutamine-hydrolysing)
MCGIVALFSRRNSITREQVQRAIRRLHHRGLDGQRQWVSSDRMVGLGHTRLSIIDLRTGDQPIASEDERVRIAVNGEFYGFEAIQRELEASGHRLRTRSDSEIALHLYEDLGVHCLHRLRGEFAFVLWDETNRRLFAARDRFGIKPLFYAIHDETIYVASEVKALFAAGVPARWDGDSVYHSVEYGGHQMRTLFKGVFQVPPGHYLLATETHLQLNRYWDFDYPQTTGSTARRSDADYETELLPERRPRLLRRARARREAPLQADSCLHAQLRPRRI